MVEGGFGHWHTIPEAIVACLTAPHTQVGLAGTSIPSTRITSQANKVSVCSLLIDHATTGLGLPFLAGRSTFTGGPASWCDLLSMYGGTRGLVFLLGDTVLKYLQSDATNPPDILQVGRFNHTIVANLEVRIGIVLAQVPRTRPCLALPDETKNRIKERGTRRHGHFHFE